ncbi:EAL domain-containing protein [Vibrio sp. TH_r3]|uniref:putative bifunctional diguanylate cyclase/phosphodiesterase n=1 Tax=Vibrio sp. TH_r3 TaxID=3082084 RepID=UPI002954754D|nr:EAL domain-containing protein [Vibrio sp. TH_r3]MDV7104836.1 EAL domain-containing protein [Vibrio sp. TH_r3]
MNKVGPQLNGNDEGTNIYDGLGIPCITTNSSLQVMAYNSAAYQKLSRLITKSEHNGATPLLTASIKSNLNDFLQWFKNEDSSYHEVVLNCNGIARRFIANCHAQTITTLYEETETTEVNYNFCFFPTDSYYSLDKDFNLYKMVFKHSIQAIYISDIDNRILSVNPSFINIFGVDQINIIGTNDSIIYDADSFSEHQNMLKLIQEERDDVVTRLRCIKYNEDHSKTYLYCNVSIINIQDTNSDEAQYLHILENVTQQVAIEQSLEKAAFVDSLTGLDNRASFNRHFSNMFSDAQRVGEKVVLFYIDLDRFKYLNDELGHEYGDLLLKHVAERLKHCFKQCDVVARIGGDEFVVMLQSDECIESLERIAVRAIKDLSKPYILDKTHYTCTCSVGVALYPDDALTQDQLLIAADSAMYDAKRNGRNNYAFFNPSEQKSQSTKQQVVKEIQLALDERQILPYYQPIHDMNSGEVVSFEALARFVDNDGVVHSPDYFLPSIEDDVLLIELGISLLNDVVIQLNILANFGVFIPISINLSSYQLRSDAVIRKFEMVASKYRNLINLIKIEVTETLIFENNQNVIVNIERLSECGFSLMLDDFGTGYSSIYSLKKFKFSTVKIDKTFIDDINSGNKQDQSLLNTIIAMIQNLGMEVICEGVQTEAQKQYLVDRGCRYGQGHYYAEAMQRTKLLDYLAR